MQNNIDSYNAQYPLEYYEIGKMYSFYTAEPALTMPPKNTKNTPSKEKIEGYIRAYGDLLAEAQDVPGIGEDKGTMLCRRFIGVVVAKKTRKTYSYITLLVQTKRAGADRFVVKNYITNHSAVLTDGKEGMTASTVLA